MMNSEIEKLSSAIEEVDAKYLEEALDYVPQQRAVRRKRGLRRSGLSAACVALLVILGVGAAVYGAGRLPLSWRDIFRKDQTVIGDQDEASVVSEPISEPGSAQTPEDPAVGAPLTDFTVRIEKVLGDERIMYLLYTVKANEGAILSPTGRFAEFRKDFAGKLMSGVYVQYFFPRREGVPANELEGAVVSYAPWQPTGKKETVTISFTDWQEMGPLSVPKAALDLEAMVAAAGDHAAIPNEPGAKHPYLWEPGQWDVPLPYGGISVCNAGWENGILQIVTKVSDTGEGLALSCNDNWYLTDSRTGKILEPEWGDTLRSPLDLNSGIGPEDCGYSYHWGFVPVEKEAIPYLEMHWGSASRYTTALSGTWKAQITDIPQTMQSRRLAENLTLHYGGKDLAVSRIECSKLSMAVYFPDYVDSTSGILGEFKAFDGDGNPVPCNWGFLADQNDDSCMIWTVFDEPIDPESIAKLTFCGETIFAE